MDDIAASFRVAIEVLTPLHVGGGGEAFLGVDAVASGGNVYIIDVECAAISAVATGLVSAEDLAQLQSGQLMGRLASALDELLSAYRRQRIPCRPYRLVARAVDRPTGSVSIALPVLDYVPASTVKGLLRTALVYALLDEVKSQVLEAARRAVAGINPGDARSLKTAGTAVEYVLLQGLKPHSRRRSFRFDAARLLRVSETVHVKADFELREFIRVNVVSYERVASRFVVAFAPGSSFTYRAEILESPARRHAGIQSLDWAKRLLEVDSRVALDTLKRGLGILSETIVEYEVSRLEARGFEMYREYLSGLARRDSDGCYVLRLGYGAGHASKTIVPWLEKNAPSIAKALRAKLSRHYERLWDNRTTTVTPQGLGVGWVRLCLCEASRTASQEVGEGCPG